MRVLHIAQILQGGTASHLAELVVQQNKDWGSEAIAVLAPQDQAEYLDRISPEQLRWFPSSQRRPGALWQFGQACRKVIREFNPQVIHLHGTFAGFVGRISISGAPMYRTPIVYCSHGWAFNMQTAPWARKLYASAEVALAGRADAIICISEYEHQTARARGLPEHLLAMVYNGIEDVSLTRSLPECQGGRIKLVFVGRDCPQKGFDVLLEAMRSLADFPVELEAIGPLPRQDFPANVTATGWLPRDEVQNRIAAADALVMPSRWEGFGLSALEAMRLGRCVIASHVDALPELILDGVTGYLVAPDDAVALATCLRRLQVEDLSRLGASARGRYLAHFSAAQMHQKTAQIYRKVLSQVLSSPGRRD